MKSKIKTIVVTSTISTILAVGTMSALQNFGQPTITERNMSSYYAYSEATLKSPHSLRKEMNRGYHDYLVVDTRAQSDYELGHITGAINIDSGQDANTVIDAFRAQTMSQDKPILIYCYSTSCMNGRKVGSLLAQNGMYIKELTIGYNEWEFYPETWNYPQEAGTYDIENFITRGTEPGKPIVDLKALSEGCGVEGELSC